MSLFRLVLVGQAQCVAQSLHEKKSDTDSTGVDVNLYGSFQLLLVLRHLAPIFSPSEHVQHEFVQEKHHPGGEKRNEPHPECHKRNWPHPECHLGAEIPLLHIAKNQDAGEGIDVASKTRDCKQNMLSTVIQKQFLQNSKHYETAQAQDSALSCHMMRTVMLLYAEREFEEPVNRKVQAGSWENGNRGA